MTRDVAGIANLLKEKETNDETVYSTVQQLFVRSSLLPARRTAQATKAPKNGSTKGTKIAFGLQVLALDREQPTVWENGAASTQLVTAAQEMLAEAGEQKRKKGRTT